MPSSFIPPDSPTSVTDSPLPSPQFDQRLLIRRFSSFWPSEKEVLKRHPSLEQLVPAHDCETRRSSLAIAIFNLVATVCGGGVLSLPLAFCRAGILPASIMMVAAALVTDFAMYIMCSCARRTASRSYSEVVRKAFGQGAEVAATVLLVSLLFFVLVAYFVLVKDIWTPVILKLSPVLSSFLANTLGYSKEDEDEANFMSGASNYLLAFLILPILLPLLLQKDLHALRHTCYVGVASAVVLMLGMVYRATELNVVQEPQLFQQQVTWVGTIDGMMFDFPIICLSFFSIYNVPLVHAALFDPTRQRVKMVMDGTILLCLLLFYPIGMAGYLYAYNDTMDNVLLNFPLSYRVILVGRIGYGVTIGFGMPLVFLPCRENILALPSHIAKWRQELAKKLPKSETDKELQREDRPLLGRKRSVSFSLFDDDNNDHDEEAASSRIQEKEANSATSLSLELCPGGYQSIRGTEFIEPEHDQPTTAVRRTRHVVTTILLVVCVYIFAVAVPGVGFVWSLVGSSMSMVIGFFLPGACYLKIRSQKGVTPRSLAASFMVAFALVASIACTARTFSRIME